MSSTHSVGSEGMNIMVLLGCSLFVLCGLWFSSANAAEIAIEPEVRAVYDHVVLSQFWPVTGCLKYTPCSIPTGVNSWQVHGLWPTMGTTIGPNSCNNAWTLPLNTITSLVPQLTIHWASSTTSTSFWSHEWLKHGTCGASTSWASEYQYFNSGLNLKQSYSIDSVLSRAGIVPSATAKYQTSNIYKAVRNGLGVTSIRIKCYKKNNLQYLYQVEVCLSTNLTALMECPVRTTTDTTLCSETMDVYYTPI